MDDHMKEDSKKSLIYQFQLLLTGINFQLHFEKEDFKRYMRKRFLMVKEVEIFKMY